MRMAHERRPCLPLLLSNAAEQFPLHPAVRFVRAELTYKELDLWSSRLAYALIEQGVNRGDRIGIYMRKSLEAVVALYGIMKAGAVYVPLDAFAPVTRIATLLEDCTITYLISEQARADRLRDICLQYPKLCCVIGLSAPPELPVKSISWEEINALPATIAWSRIPGEQDLAYILYTSGSTGTPKGIMHTHRSALSFVEWACQTYLVSHEDRISSHAPFHFDLSIFDLFASAAVGATTVLIPENITKFPASLSEYIAQERITIWYSVPFALTQLLLHGALSIRDLSSLRWILFAGEAFPTKHLRQLMKQLPHARFSNLYGPTETNVCTYYHVASLPEDVDEPLSIGKACEHTELMMIDADEQPVERGEVGELLVKGAPVMTGYWARPELTRQAFCYKQTSGKDELFYRTGDLVRLRADGYYMLLGRKDRQVKVRGYRIELDEIETALLSFPPVIEAAVYTLPDELGSQCIECAVLLRSEITVSIPQIVSHLSRKIPAYAIPGTILITEDFPRTSTGKIDRRTLQAQAQERYKAAARQVPSGKERHDDRDS